MKPILLSVSLLCVLFVDAQLVIARDVQLRSRPGDATSSISTSSNTSSTNTSSSTRKLSTEERLQRLERILESQGLVDMLVKIENLQSELQILRGELELHTHQLDEIKQRQRDLYVDIDRRLLRLERNGPGLGSTSSTGTTSSGVATPPAGTAGKAAGTAATAGAASTKSPKATSATGKTDFAAEQKAYQKAFDLLRELRYEQAVTAFNGFIKEFPKGRYAHIAQYWIGEANYAQRNFKQAITDYQKLIDNYPNSPKLAEAMLKIGYSQYELKKFKQAEATLKQLSKNYPGTTEAGQATNLIQKIRLKR